MAPMGHRVIMWLLPQHQHKSVKDKVTSFTRHSSTNKKHHFTAKWKLPCGHSHIVLQVDWGNN